jgi:H+/gluconate symporter-like permease
MVYTFLPAILMFIFGLLTIANIRQSHRHVAPQNQTQIRKHRLNNQLFKMLFIQVITILLTISPFIIYRLRASLIANNMKSQYQLAQENLFLQTATVVSLISPSISFYLFTLSGTIFRRELLRILSTCLQVK